MRLLSSLLFSTVLATSTSALEFQNLLLKDIQPGSGSAIPFGDSKPVLWNGKMFFPATDGSIGVEPWVSDGTPLGTDLLLDLNSGSANSLDPYIYQGKAIGVEFQSKVWFIASNGNSSELWSTDGTAAGTTVFAQGAFSNPNSLTVVGSKLYFVASTSTHGTEIHWTDGSTHQVLDLISGPSGTNPYNLSALPNGQLYFTGTPDTDYDAEPWITDGTLGGTLKTDLVPGANASYPGRAFILGSSALVAANDATGSRNIYRISGTTLTPIGGAPTTFDSGFVHNGKYIYPYSGFGTGEEWAYTDGVSLGNYPELDSRTDSSSKYQRVASLGSNLFFWGRAEATNTIELYVDNGTGPTLVGTPSRQAPPTSDYWSNYAGGKAWTEANQAFFYANIDGKNTLVQLAQNSGTWGLKPLLVMPDSTSRTGPIVRLGGHLAFAMQNQNHGSEWRILNAVPESLRIENPIMIPETASVGAFIGKLKANDWDGDNLSWLVLGDTATIFQRNDSLFLKRKVDYEAQQGISLTLWAKDPWQTGYTVQQPVALGIGNVNEAPYGLRFFGLDTIPGDSVVSEFTRSTFAIGRLSAQDPEGGAMSWRLKNTMDTLAFRIQGDTLWALPGFDYERLGLISVVEVIARDNLGAESVLQVTLTTVNQNEGPTPIGLSADKITENSLPGSFIGKLQSSDPEAGSVTFVMDTNQLDGNQFFVRRDSLFTRSVLDFESKSMLKVLVQASDSMGLSRIDTLKIQVLNLNEPITGFRIVGLDGIAGDSVTQENLPVGTAIGLLQAVDPENAKINWNLKTKVDSSRFIVRGDTLFLKQVLDYEALTLGQVLVEFIADDMAGNYYGFSLNLNVLNVDEAPNPTQLQSNGIAENAPNGSLVGRLLGSDPEGSTVVFSLAPAQPDNSLFEIRSDSVLLRGSIDYEQDSLLSLVVETNAGGMIRLDTLVVQVKNVNDPLQATVSLGDSVWENMPALTRVGFLKGHDPEGSPLSYFLEPGLDQGYFAIYGDTLKTNSTMDFESQNIRKIIVKTQALSGETRLDTLGIRILNSNEVPLRVVASKDTIFGQSPAGTKIADLVGSDADIGDSVSLVLLGALDGAAFQLSGSELRLIVEAQLPAQKPIYSIVVKSIDRVGATRLDTLRFNVAAPLFQPNRAPSFVSLQPYISLKEDQDLVTIAQWAKQISSGLNEQQTLHFRVRPGDTAIMNKLGNDPQLIFSQLPQVDPTTGDLSFKFQPDVHGYIPLLVQLRDDGGTQGGGVDSSVEVNLVLEVVDRNDPPRPESNPIPDTLKSFGDQKQILNRWLPTLLPGPKTEQLAGQQIKSVDLIVEDPSAFVVQPAINLSTGDLILQTKLGYTGQQRLKLVIKDNGGVADGGVDSLVQDVIMVAKSSQIPIAAEPKLPTFTNQEIAFVKVDTTWEWTWDTNVTPQRGSGQMMVYRNGQNTYFRVAPTAALGASRWVLWNNSRSWDFSPRAMSKGTALGTRWSGDSAFPSNAVMRVVLSTTDGQVLDSTEVKSWKWVKPFLAAGQYRLKAQLMVAQGALSVVDSQLSVDGGALAPRFEGASDSISAWVMTGLTPSATGYVEALAWDAQATADPLMSRYRALASTEKPKLGQGYWVAVNQELALDMGPAQIPDSVEVQLLPNNEGWNQVANPYPFPIGDGVRGADSLTCWNWDRRKRDYVRLEGPLAPFAACWVWTDRLKTVTFYPVPDFDESKPTQARLGDQPLAVHLIANGYEDTDNRFGWSTDEEYLPELPGPSRERAQVAFYEKGKLWQNAIRTGEQTDVWDLRIWSEVSGLSTGQLTFQGLEQLHQQGQALYWRTGGSTWTRLGAEAVPVRLGREMTAAQIKIGPAQGIASSIKQIVSSQGTWNLSFPHEMTPDRVEWIDVQGATRWSSALRAEGNSWFVVETPPPGYGYLRLVGPGGLRGEAQPTWIP